MPVEEIFVGFEGTSSPLIAGGVGIEVIALNCCGRDGEILDTRNGEVAGFGGEEYML